MIVRTHNADGLYSKAEYSDCGAYRYLLKRRWDACRGVLNFIMLNPSVADEFRNDPTVERCERRARRLGYGAFSVTNIFAWRDTDPSRMRRAEHPVGPENDRYLLTEAAEADQVIIAWGIHGAHLQRGPEVAEMLGTARIPLFHLGQTKNGHPRHPLYVSYSRKPDPWTPVNR